MLPHGEQTPRHVRHVFAVGVPVAAQQRECVLDGDREAFTEEPLGLVNHDAAAQRGPQPWGRTVSGVGARSCIIATQATWPGFGPGAGRRR